MDPDLIESGLVHLWIQNKPGPFGIPKSIGRVKLWKKPLSINNYENHLINL